jgi:hypothetical protein
LLRICAEGTAAKPRKNKTLSLFSRLYSDSVHFQLPAKIHANKKDKNTTVSVLHKIGFGYRSLSTVVLDTDSIRDLFSLNATKGTAVIYTLKPTTKRNKKTDRNSI